MADIRNGLSRRNLAGAALIGTTALAGGVVSAPSADARLIAMGIEGRHVGEEHQRRMVGWWALKENDPNIDRVGADLQILLDRMWELNEQAVTLKATSPEGWRAKAELARHSLIVECEDKAGKMDFGKHVSHAVQRAVRRLADMGRAVRRAARIAEAVQPGSQLTWPARRATAPRWTGWVPWDRLEAQFDGNPLWRMIG